MDGSELGSLKDIYAGRTACSSAYAPVWLLAAAVAVPLSVSTLLRVTGFHTTVGLVLAWVAPGPLFLLIASSPQWHRYRGVRGVYWRRGGKAKASRESTPFGPIYPTPHTDALIASRTRLIVCGLLDSVDSITLERLAKTLNLSQSALTHDITTLERAGYIEIRPDTKDSGQQWIALSAKGLTALANHEVALQVEALGPT